MRSTTFTMRSFIVSLVTTSVLFISIYEWIDSSWTNVAAGRTVRRTAKQVSAELPPDYYENVDQHSGLDVLRACSDRETPVQKAQPEPVFCKPELVHPQHLRKKRTCVCADGYVRNAWGRCIRENKCKLCKKKQFEDYNDFCVCAYQCGKPAAMKCGKDCRPGCDCPPGFSRLASGACVRINECLPICPANSTFQLCYSGCERLCRLGPRKKCTPSCNVGNCICIEGYAMESGICYPWNKCPRK